MNSEMGYNSHYANIYQCLCLCGCKTSEHPSIVNEYIRMNEWPKDHKSKVPLKLPLRATTKGFNLAIIWAEKDIRSCSTTLFELLI